MARRGDLAREQVVKTIMEAFGNRVVAFQDKKIYVNETDGPGGETIQFAISMTMPKTTITAAVAPTGQQGAWSNTLSTGATTAPAPQVQLSQDDKEMVAKLMKDLGIED